VRRLAAAFAADWFDWLLTGSMILLIWSAGAGRLPGWQLAMMGPVAGLLAGGAIQRARTIRRLRTLMDIQTRTLTSNYRTITLQEEMLKDQGWVRP
jgi:hypothetical protein